MSVDRNHLLSCLELGRDSVIIPSPRFVRRAGGKSAEERRRNRFSERGQRIGLRCVAETGPERSVLLAGGNMSVA